MKIPVLFNSTAKSVSSVNKSVFAFCLSMTCLSGFNIGYAAQSTEITQALAHPSRPSHELRLDTVRKPGQVLEFFQIESGMQVIDLFSGEGYYTEILSHLVGSKGSVAMHNHSVWEAYSKKGSDARVANNRLANVYQLMKDLNHTRLKANHYDAATMILGMHDLYLKSEKSESGDKINVQAFLLALYQGIKPGGVVGVIEHEAKKGMAPAESAELHRTDSEHIIKEMQKAGFVLEAQASFLRNNEDDHSKVVWEKGLRRHTDRAVLRFRKPA